MVSESFKKPLVQKIDAGDEEKIYGFSRRYIFSPEITGNLSIRCCAVSAPVGAQSIDHIHPGDEVVISRRGENRNFVGGLYFALKSGQAITVPPGTLHSTKVTGVDGWEGISFYCDQCPFVGPSHTTTAGLVAMVKPLEMPVFGPTLDLHSNVLFSPLGRETAFMQISLVGGARGSRCEVAHRGESVYVPLRGFWTLSWPDGESMLQPGMAAAIPAGFRHTLGLDGSSSKASLAICSCSSCSLADFDSVLT